MSIFNWFKKPKTNTEPTKEILADELRILMKNSKINKYQEALYYIKLKCKSEAKKGHNSCLFNNITEYNLEAVKL